MPIRAAIRGAVFSDVDGTLVHTADDVAQLGEISSDGRIFRPKTGSGELQIMQLLPTSTGMRGYISERSLQLMAELRQRGVIVVLISGARVSTVFERLPFLPYADALVVENGGRIFLRHNAKLLTAVPLTEDVAWREVHVAAGPITGDVLPPGKRSGELWDLYRRMEAQGWACDAQRYTTDFRVKVSKSVGKSEADLHAVIASLPKSIASSYNLGSADFYPSTSGKDKAARYLMQKFDLQPQKCVSIGDDDNDLGLADVVGHTYITAFTSPSVQAAVELRPASFTVASESAFLATEEVLQAVHTRFISTGLVGVSYRRAGITALTALIVLCMAGALRRMHVGRHRVR